MRRKIKALMVVFIVFAVLTQSPVHASTYSRGKAVLVLPQDFAGDPSFSPYAENFARVLNSYGVQCICLRGADCTKKNIIKHAQGANILYYLGHGNDVDWGFYLDGDFFTRKEIQDNLRLSPNAIVFLQLVCYATGSTGTDIGPVPADVALYRICEYASTFLPIGARAYIATSWGEKSAHFMNAFLSQETRPIEEVFTQSLGCGDERYQAAHIYYPQYLTIFYKDPLGWSSAFVGDTELTPSQIFCGLPALSGISGANNINTASNSSGSIYGQVLNARGRVIPGTCIRINNTNMPTNPGGEFRFTLVHPGIYTVYYDAPGYIGQTQVVEVKPEEEMRCPTCILSPGVVSSTTGSIYGRVISRITGRVIPGTCIRIDSCIMPTNPGGEFRFTLVHPGIYTVYYDAPGYIGQTQMMEVKAGQEANCPTCILSK